MTRLAGGIGIVLGACVIGLGILDLTVRTALALWLQQVPVIGSWIIEATSQLLAFNYSSYVYLAFGIFSIFWGGALLARASWARVAGLAVIGAGVFYTLAIIIVVFAIQSVGDYRWWVLGVGLALILLQIAFLYDMTSPDTIKAFAAKHVNLQDNDLPAVQAPAPKSPEPAPKSTEPPVRPTPAPPPPPQPAAKVLARLEALQGGIAFDIARESVVIGRGGGEEPCDIVVGMPPDCAKEDTSVSRVHARITRTPEGFILKDESANGTDVNGQKYRKGKEDTAPLKDGDNIRFGKRDTQFTFRVP